MSAPSQISRTAVASYPLTANRSSAVLKMRSAEVGGLTLSLVFGFPRACAMVTCLVYLPVDSGSMRGQGAGCRVDGRGFATEGIGNRSFLVAKLKRIRIAEPVTMDHGPWTMDQGV